MHRKTFWFLVMIWTLSACLRVSPPPGPSTPLAFPTASQTPTPIWFPPTPTFTPLPIQTAPPTPDWFETINGVWLADSFTDPQAWGLIRSTQGSISIQEGFLVLAAQPTFNLVTLRNAPTFDNFYLEVTAELNLCRGEDLYGVLFRSEAKGAYRYGLDCKGQVRLDRVSGGLRYALYAPTLSGDAPPGAPGIVRLGIWAQNQTLRFFLNGRFQFEVRDGTLSRGQIGFFARPAGDTPLTVRFANLVVYSLRP
ncbi:MAG: hypothetical protein WHS87_07035 [Anaerolineales bacterium]